MRIKYVFPEDCITPIQKRRFRQKFRRENDIEFKDKGYKASRNWIEKNKERQSENLSKWWIKNKDILSSKRKIYREEHRESEKLRRDILEIKLKYKSKNILKKYKLTEEQYNNILVKQNNSCAICKTIEPGGKGGWHIDHNHKTGKIRGLLCHYCNTGLGLFKDNKNNLMEAIGYLVKNDLVEN